MARLKRVITALLALFRSNEVLDLQDTALATLLFLASVLVTQPADRACRG